jgi:hypothetical protein
VGVHSFRLEDIGKERFTVLGLFVRLRSRLLLPGLSSPRCTDASLQQWFFMFQVFYCLTVIPVKLSMGWMLVRIARGRKAYIYSQYLVMALFTAMNITAALYVIFQCSPVGAAWDKTLAGNGGGCLATNYLAGIYYAATAVNIATDWFTALMFVFLFNPPKLAAGVNRSD